MKFLVATEIWQKLLVLSDCSLLHVFYPGKVIDMHFLYRLKTTYLVRAAFDEDRDIAHMDWEDTVKVVQNDTYTVQCSPTMPIMVPQSLSHEPPL